MNYTLELQDYKVILKENEITYVIAETYKLLKGWYLFYIGGEIVERIPATYVQKVVCDD